MFITIAPKHVLIATADIFIDLLLIIVILGTGLSEASSWNMCTILYIGLIGSNVLLIFVFADWRDYFCIRNMLVKENEIKAKSSSSVVVLRRSSPLQVPLLDKKKE